MLFFCNVFKTDNWSSHLNELWIEITKILLKEGKKILNYYELLPVCMKTRTKPLYIVLSLDLNSPP